MYVHIYIYIYIYRPAIAQAFDLCPVSFRKCLTRDRSLALTPAGYTQRRRANQEGPCLRSASFEFGMWDFLVARGTLFRCP